MGTYNLTKGDTAISALDFHRMFCARIEIDIEAIIAADATLEAAAKITAADIIQLFDVPALTILYPCLAYMHVVTAGAGTVSVGIAGSTEIFSSVSIAAAGVIFCTEDSATWGTDNYGGVEFESTDTIDMTFGSDNTTGLIYLYLPGAITET